MNKSLSIFYKFFVLLFLIFFVFSDSYTVTHGQETQSKIIKSCPFAFTRNLHEGDDGRDVKVLQEILNSDKRTQIAVSGVGSPGQESTHFGPGTKLALKKFQALFYEFSPLPPEQAAHGKFDDVTRKIAQAICDGQMIDEVFNQDYTVNKPNTNTNQQVTQTTNAVEKLAPTGPGPQITLTANGNKIETTETFKIFLDSDKEIKPITPDIFIVEGAQVKEIRKLSKTKYFVTFTPEEDSMEVSIQIEAEKVYDLNGNTNELASNEITFKLDLSQIKTNTTSDTQDLGNSLDGTALQNLLGNLLSGNGSATKDCNGIKISSLSPCNPSLVSPSSSNGNVSNTQTSSTGSGSGSGSGGGGGGMGDFQQMLGGLMKGLSGGGGGGLGGLFGGNKSGAPQGGGGGGYTDSGNSIPPQPSALEKATSAMNSACANDQKSQECLDAKGTMIFEQAKSDSLKGKCGGEESDSNFRGKIFPPYNITVNHPKPRTSLDQMPVKIAILLGEIRAKCTNCRIEITGGTEPGHQTHGPKIAIFDLSKNDKSTNNVIRNIGKSIGASGVFTERYLYKGAVFNYEVPKEGEPHWHVVAENYVCGS